MSRLYPQTITLSHILTLPEAVQRAQDLRAEGRFDEARVELAKAAARRRVARNG